MRCSVWGRSVRSSRTCSPLGTSAAFAALAILALPVSSRSDSLAAKADGFLNRPSARASANIAVIVRTDGPLSPAQRRDLRAAGAVVSRTLPIVRSVAIRVPGRSLARVADLPFVKRLSADVPITKCDEFTVQHTGADLAYQQMRLDGNGVGVAVVDSGIRGVDDLEDPSGASRVAAQVSFVPQQGPDDKCGHGTHVAGIIAGSGADSTGPNCYRTFYGVARQARIVNVRVLDSRGEGSVSGAVAGIQWVIANRTRFNIRVLNLSLGHPVGESYTTDPLCQAVEAAWKAGIVVVCAAGNNGRLQTTPDASMDNEGYGTAYGSIQSPANDPYVITVGAVKSIDGTRSDDRIATYSSRGPSRLDFVLKPDIVAPGNRVISLDANNSYLDRAGSATSAVRLNEYTWTGSSVQSNTYYRLSGTSMAAPVVAGAAALMLQADPELTPDTVKARLMISADKWAFPDSTANPCVFGAGYLNIPAALQCTLVATQPAMSPTLSRDYLGNVTINMDLALWGALAIWGTGVTDLRDVWGTRAIWGASANILDASMAIWGSTVWSDMAIWGSGGAAVDLSGTALTGED